MNILNFIRNIFFPRSSIKVGLSQAITPIENISFPDNYKSSNVYHRIPSRSLSSVNGSQFGDSILNISATQQRDNLIYQQCIDGNLPPFMSDFKSITITDNQNILTIFVAPDVLCIGDNNDFLRVTLNGYTSKKVADLFDCMLPTKVIADHIWMAADLKLMPTAMGASFEMITTATFISHNTIIEKQRAGRNFNIITGHKKDVVYAKHLLSDRSRLGIYGWMRPDNGIPIQGPTPNSTSHSIDYQDYSSGIRLVSRLALLNSNVVDLQDDVLNNNKYCYLISDEGAYDATTIYNK